MKILSVFAHPDDETFGPGGTLSRYSLTGHTVRLVTLTHGEAGTLGPAEHLTKLELGHLRAEELRCAAKELHLSGLNLYQLPDGKLAELPAERGLTVIRQEINTFLPDALITFHAAGISGHPDHQTVARWCLQAVQERTNPPRMYAYGISSEQAQRVSHRKLTPIPEDEITHVIDVSHYLDCKFRAIHCHQSQSEAWAKIQSVAGGILSYLRFEHFSQVWPIPEQKRRTDRLED